MCKYCKVNHSPKYSCQASRVAISVAMSKVWEELGQEISDMHMHPSDGIAAQDIAEWILEQDLDTTTKEALEFLKISVLTKKVREFLKGRGIYRRYVPGTFKKTKETLVSKYGVENFGQMNASKNYLSRRNNAEVLKISGSAEEKAYRDEVRRITARSLRAGDLAKKSDYYTGIDFIEELCNPMLMQGSLYPTVDHKLSVFHCFFNGIPAEVCGGIDNLAYSFRWVNTMKGNMTEEEFRGTMLPNIKIIVQKFIEDNL